MKSGVSLLRLLLPVILVWWCCESTYSYRAAVVEYDIVGHGSTKLSPKELMLKNAQRLAVHIENAADRGAQIVVLPEYSLFGASFHTRAEVAPYLVEVVVGQNPCQEKNGEVLSTLSCVAKKMNIVVVVDVGEKEQCSSNEKCPSDGQWQYNTQVAFGANGEVLAKYRKTNLYFEPQYDAPINQGPQTFMTPFGVRFGMMICYDIIFAEPAASVLALGVQDIVYSSWWVNADSPVMTAVGTTQAWSAAKNVNMLVANAGTGWYNSGTGIYSRGNALASFYNDHSSPAARVLVADVQSSLVMVPSYNLDAMTTTTHLYQATENTKGPFGLESNIHIFSPAEATSEKNYRICVDDTGICCTFSYSVESAGRSESFGLVAATGRYKGMFEAHLCAIAKCHSKSSCLQTAELTAATRFDFVKISASFNARDSHVVYNEALTTGGQLFNGGFTVSDSQDTMTSLEGKVSLSPLLGATILSRPRGT